MTDYTPIGNFRKKITPKFLYKFEGSHYVYEGMNPKLPEIPQPKRPPTIDEAMQNQIEGDRLRRRRGVLANIYGGANPTPPTVGVKQLLGS